MKRSGMLDGKFELNPENDFNLGVARALFDQIPPLKTKMTAFINYNFFKGALKETLTTKYSSVLF